MKRGAARWIWLAVGAAAIVFAVQGGEFSTLDLLGQWHAKRAIVRQIDSLQTLTDSLARELKAIQTDTAVQERIAREEFGMVRGDRELLYRFAEPDSARK